MDRTADNDASGHDAANYESVQRSFETPRGVRLRVENAAGEVEIETHDLPRTEVSVVALNPSADEIVRSARIVERPSARGHEIVVEIPHIRGKARLWSGAVAVVRVFVKVPPDSELEVSSASASVAARGRYQAADIHTASGSIAVEEVTGKAKLRTASGAIGAGNLREAADVQSASGDVSIVIAGAGGRVSTASGDVDLGRAGKLTRIRAASGDVRLGEALEGADIETVSGDQRIERAVAGDYVLKAVSGDIVVAVVPGSLVRFDAGSMSGRVASEIDLEATRPDTVSKMGKVEELSIQAKTISGDISVARAAS